MRKRVKIFDNEDDMYKASEQPKDIFEQQNKRVHFNQGISSFANQKNKNEKSDASSESESDSDSGSESESHGRSHF